MDLSMLFQIFGSREAIPTHRAHVSFLAGVYFLVLFQVAQLREHLSTERAQENLLVNFLVYLQVLG